MAVPVTKVLDIDPTIEQLSALLGDRLTTSAAVCERHGQGESYHEGAPPQAVVYPQSTEEVAQIVRICAAAKVPMIPFGTGTSLEGHVVALAGGVCIDMMQMNQILQVHAEDLDVVVQPGVTRKELNNHLRDTGLFFPMDPGADASLGGMTATRASGTNAVRYGTMREAVIALTVVFAAVIAWGGGLVGKAVRPTAKREIDSGDPGQLPVRPLLVGEIELVGRTWTVREERRQGPRPQIFILTAADAPTN